MPREHAALTPVPFTDVEIDDGFWSPRLETLREVTVEEVYERLEETGRIDNFRIAAGEREGEFGGRFYNDSDVYKWLEAASYLLALGDDPDLEARVDGVIDAVAGAQEPDGYLNTYFTLEEPDAKWTNLHLMHELYCAGHLFEAAVAHRRATGEERLLDVATALADHVDDVFSEKRGAPGHEEIELALVELYRETGTERYLDLAGSFVDERGREPSRFEWELDHPDETAGGSLDAHLRDDDGAYDPTYLQDQAPVREQEAVEGHAVRATYLLAGATDLAMETGDPELRAAVERLWTNMVTKRSYVTGGIGSSHDGERFTDDYDLPNETAYAETCAALGSVRWNHRLLQLVGEGRFGDVLERTLYNALLAGVSLSGDRFFYANPLEVNGDRHALHDVDERRFGVERQGWFATACCPTNVPRLLAALGGLAYLRDDDGDVYVNLYLGSEADVGDGITLRQETSYPWAGEVRVTVDVAEPTRFGLELRVPEWCASFSLAVDGDAVAAEPGDGFVRVERTWEGGETVDLDLAMPVERLVAHPAVAADAGRVALRRGPLVYCLEGVDHDRPLHGIAVGDDVEAVHEPDLLDGVTTLRGGATVPDLDDWADAGALYRRAADAATREGTFTAVPYYAWGHREPGEMRVWLRPE